MCECCVWVLWVRVMCECCVWVLCECMTVVCECVIWFLGVLSPCNISGWVRTCDSGHAWRRYSAAPLGNQATGTIKNSSLSNIILTPDTELTSPFPYPSNAECLARRRQVSILITGLTWLGIELPTSHAHARPTLYRLGHHALCECMLCVLCVCVVCEWLKCQCVLCDFCEWVCVV